VAELGAGPPLSPVRCGRSGGSRCTATRLSGPRLEAIGNLARIETREDAAAPLETPTSSRWRTSRSRSRGRLAHDGLFAGYFICNARDAIALETVPHALRQPDVLAFIRLSRINAQALHTIAKDRTVMREYAHRLAFCRRPRAKGPELDG
jgi:hypothetical protein